jgi:hypothetical protein
MSLGAAVAVLTVAFTCSVWAKGGISMKAPQPFTKEELILIEKCRHLAQPYGGRESARYVRECGTVMLYIRY